MNIPDFLTDVTNKTQMVPSRLDVNPNGVQLPKVDYNNISETYWQAKGLTTYYQKGLLLGRGDTNNISLREFLKKFKKLMEEIIRHELSLSSKTAEEYKDDFKVMEHFFNMLVMHLEKDQLDIKSEKAIATIQGFINAYIDSVK